MKKSITIFKFFQKIKCKILLEANIDNVMLPTLNINIPIFKNPQTKF